MVQRNRRGDLALKIDDLALARSEYEAGLEIAERLAKQDPGNAQYQRDLWSSLSRLRGYPDSGITWARIVAHLAQMERQGMLRPADRKFLDEARVEARKEASKRSR